MRSLVLFLFLARAAAGAVYVVPVATAKFHDRFYSTTLFLHNPTGVTVRCESVYAIPNDPESGTLRSNYELPPRTTRVEERTLQEAGAIGTLRFDCTDELLLAARVQTSTDGRTFDGGRIFRGVGEDHPITAAAPRSVATATDLLLMEVGGAPVTVQARVLDGTGSVIAERSYEIPAFAQQIVNLSALRTTATQVEVTVAGNGAVVAEPEGAAVAIRLVASSVRPQATSPARSMTPLSGFPASFKGAPFQDPATGLIQMRDRWYDPSTGTFLSADPEGYADSANLYLFGKGDPVNNSDPTGRHTFVKRKVNGLEFELLAPDLDEVRQGILAMSGSFLNPLTGRRESFAWDQHASELLLMQARLGNPLMQDAFEQFFGMTHNQVDVSGLRLYWNSLWHHKSDIALSTGFVLAMLAPEVRLVDPKTLRWTQRTAGGGGRADTIRASMSKGWSGEPIDAVATEQGLVTVDHTRAAVAIELNMTRVPVRIHLPGELLPPEMLGRFGNARTWGEAAAQRAAAQRPPLPPTGTPTPPRLPRPRGER